VACTFGLLAIDILTTTGARRNELLQISNTKECIEVKKINNKLHYSYKAIPKGRDSLEEFYLSKQTMEHIQTVSRMLKHIMTVIKFQVSYTVKQESTYSPYLIISNMQVKVKHYKELLYTVLYDFYFMDYYLKGRMEKL